MKLKSIVVKNFKIHKEQRVDFEDQITLVSGPNETGKSTILEALKKAFFLRARGGSEDHKSIRSTLHSGTPEVEVEFSVGAGCYTLFKSFAGAKGVARLQQHGGAVWNGDEVDSRLAELLRVGNASKLDGQWDHLLVAQRQSGMDPTAHANLQNESLVRRLQAEGGAAVVLSARDQAVASQFEEIVAATFTQTQARAGSNLAKAIAQESAALVARNQAEARQVDLLNAAQDFTEASELIQRKAADLELSLPKKNRVEAQLATAQELIQKKELQHLDVSNKAAAYDRLAAGDRKIQELRPVLGQLRNDVQPLEGKVAVCKITVAESRDSLARANAESASAELSEREARSRQRFVAAWVHKLESETRAESLGKQVAAIESLKQDLKALEERKTGLPLIDDRKLGEIQRIERLLGEAVAVRNATATKVKLLAATVPVRIGNQTIPVGQEIVLTGESELAAGDLLRLAISPGGESGLQKAVQAVVKAEEKFRAALQEMNVASVEEAQRVNKELASLTEQINGLLRRIQASNAAQIEADFSEARNALLTANQAFTYLQTQMPPLEFPASIGDSRLLLQTQESDLQKAESARTAAGSGKERAQKTLDSRLKEIADLESKLASKGAEIRGKEIELDFLLQEYGIDASRAEALQGAFSAKSTAEGTLANTEARIQELQIDQLRRDQKRLALVIHQNEQDIQQAETRKAVAGSKLYRDGSEDPEAELQRCRIAHDRAVRDLAGIRSKAEAHKLLHDIFQSEKSQLVQQYTRPLADKIRAYLQCLFGPGLTVDLVLNQNNFEGIKICRTDFGNVPFDFDQLSGGAAEQVAAAFRLAIAQILAQEHDGSLPVVFDDAFTNSDSDRVAKLQSMLYLAAENGLQIIVLSCNSKDYSETGARETAFTRRPLQTLAAVDKAVVNPDAEKQPGSHGVVAPAL